MRRRVLVYVTAGAPTGLFAPVFAPVFTHETSNHFDENDRAEGPSLIYTQPRVWLSLGKPRKDVEGTGNDADSAGDVTSTPCSKPAGRFPGVPLRRQTAVRCFTGVRDLGVFTNLMYLKPVLATRSYRRSTWPSTSADAVISKSHEKFTLMEWHGVGGTKGGVASSCGGGGGGGSKNASRLSAAFSFPP